MKLRPLTVLSQVYRIWGGLRMEDACMARAVGT